MSDVDNDIAQLQWNVDVKPDWTVDIDPATHVLTMKPPQDWHGTETFTLTVSDVDGLSATEHLNVTVTPVNDAPWDVNMDSIVNVFDLVLVGSQFGQIGIDLIGDVNADGDLVVSLDTPLDLRCVRVGIVNIGIQQKRLVLLIFWKYDVW